MYKYTLVTEQEDKLEKFQEGRIKAFDEIEEKLKGLIEPLRRAKIETIKYYRDVEPKSYSVVYGTDLINDYIKDIQTLLKKD
jgi:muramidase (phage lysozyme)|tara:strand:- start:904 stop:1149 length:246 start_codon:yes stop_codon:yes gene_type:complete